MTLRIVSTFTFNYPILLESSNRRGFMNNSSVLEKEATL